MRSDKSIFGRYGPDEKKISIMKQNWQSLIMEGGYLIVVSTDEADMHFHGWNRTKQIMERDRTELLDQYIGEIAYNKYLMNGINEKQ
ncbi:MAG: hypothetical protein ACLVCH_03380 [Roseburia inulinivorans]